MATQKPSKPNVTLPNNFGGIKTPYTQAQIDNGYQEAVPQVVDGGNVNYEKDGIFQKLKYAESIADVINGTPVKKVVEVDANNNFDYSRIGVYAYETTRTFSKDEISVSVESDGQVALYRSLANNNTGNSLKNGNFWEQISLGGGLEIGDIGFAPLGIDETQNKRRYLNGQVISQTQFSAFADKVKAVVALYPSLAATETNWQAEVTNSKLGQCGKFVINDTAGTIRLPKVANINGLQNLANLGKIKAESLPNITGAGVWIHQSGTSGGAFYSETGTINQNASDSGIEAYNHVFFDASRSSSAYQNNAPVQQEAVQYPYFIQVATGSKESVDVSTEIQLSNPFNLFDSKWADHELNNASWVKSNGTYYSGTTYVAAYNELLAEYNNASSVEKTEESITYRLTPKGFKIALSSQDTNITTLYNKTGVAWYYVLDIENTQFKLPRTKWGFVGYRDSVGNYVAESLPNIKGNSGSGSNVYNSNDRTPPSGAFAKGSSYGQVRGGEEVKLYNTSFNASRSSSTYQDNAPVQQRSTQMFLYFYVGETVQDANVINAAGVLTRVADLSNSYISGLSMPSDKYINLPLGASGSTYTAPANGWFHINGGSKSGNKWVNISNDIGSMASTSISGVYNAKVLYPVRKGDIVTVSYTLDTDNMIFKFIYAEGDN